MGVLNVTPDSFFDGGRHDDIQAAVQHGLKLTADGADILDIGGESTRPGHATVAPSVQIERIAPVVKGIRAASDVIISIDTTHRSVAEACLDAGADWINDTTAFRDDPTLASLIAERGCPIVLMHRFDPPRRDDTSVHGRDLVQVIAEALSERVEFAIAQGVRREQIMLDPGIGFGTLPADNLAIHAHLEPLQALDLPLLYGPSRKSFIGAIVDKGPDGRLFGTAASIASLALGGIEVLRVHDIAEMRDVVAVADAIKTGRMGSETLQEPNAEDGVA